jgi:tetratricopeptide (TPR) repeat protein
MDCEVPVHHYGYLNEARKQKKALVYLQLGYEKLYQFSNDLQAIHELAVQAAQLEQWLKAVKLWQYLIKIKPDYAEAHVNLAGIYWQTGQYKRAYASANAAIAIDRDLKEAYYNAAISLMLLGKIDESIELLKKILAEHNDYLSARFMLAAALSFSGDAKNCVKELKDCKKEMPGQVISIAVDNLIERLQTNGQKVYGKRFKEAAASMYLH